MKPIYIYIRYILAFLAAAIGGGVIAPPLISSPTDAGLIAGVIVIVLIPIGMYYLISPIYKSKN